MNKSMPTLRIAALLLTVLVYLPVTATLVGGIARLVWQLAPEAAAQQVEVSRNQGAWEAAAILAKDATRFVYPVKRSGHFTFCLRGQNANGVSAWSNSAWVDVK